MDYERRFAHVNEAFAGHRTTEDAREGVTGFFKKRNPTWKGRYVLLEASLPMHPITDVPYNTTYRSTIVPTCSCLKRSPSVFENSHSAAMPVQCPAIISCMSRSTNAAAVFSMRSLEALIR